MLSSKERANLRAQANGLEITLMVGKGGVSDAVIEEAERVLEAKELVKGKALETALMTAREVSDAICAATGADGVATAGSTFVIYRKSKKLEAEREKRDQYFHDEAVKAAIARRQQMRNPGSDM